MYHRVGKGVPQCLCVRKKAVFVVISTCTEGLKVKNYTCDGCCGTRYRFWSIATKRCVILYNIDSLHIFLLRNNAGQLR